MRTDVLFLKFLIDLVVGGLWILSVARLTRLITVDEITDPIRIWIFGRYGEQSRIGYLVTCAWCMSMWVAWATAPAVIVLRDLSWWTYPLLALAGSYITGLSASNLERDDIDIEITEDPQRD